MTPKMLGSISKLQFNHRAILFILFILSLVPVAISAEELSFPTEVTETLDKAGDNRGNLEKVLRHYASEGDSLKLEAAYYLIGNMTGHRYASYSLEVTAEAEIALNVLD